MKQFRIIQKGPSFYVQIRTLLFFWHTYWEETERGTNCYITFPSESAAEEFVHHRLKKTSDLPKKVIKYL